MILSVWWCCVLEYIRVLMKGSNGIPKGNVDHTLYETCVDTKIEHSATNPYSRYKDPIIGYVSIPCLSSGDFHVIYTLDFFLKFYKIKVFNLWHLPYKQNRKWRDFRS
jgi:hypothetical protein